jgi:hypothetical protein
MEPLRRRARTSEIHLPASHTVTLAWIDGTRQGAKPICQASASAPKAKRSRSISGCGCGAPLSLEADACGHGVQVRYYE